MVLHQVLGRTVQQCLPDTYRAHDALQLTTKNRIVPGTTQSLYLYLRKYIPLFHEHD